MLSNCFIIFDNDGSQITYQSNQIQIPLKEWVQRRVFDIYSDCRKSPVSCLFSRLSLPNQAAKFSLYLYWVYASPPNFFWPHCLCFLDMTLGEEEGQVPLFVHFPFSKKSEERCMRSSFGSVNLIYCPSVSSLVRLFLFWVKYERFLVATGNILCLDGAWIKRIKVTIH